MELFQIPRNSDEAAALVRQCPADFKTSDNPWSRFATSVRMLENVEAKNWNFTSNDSDARINQQAFVLAVIASPLLSDEDRDSVVGWALSQMLSGIPVLVPISKAAW